VVAKALEPVRERDQNAFKSGKLFKLSTGFGFGGLSEMPGPAKSK
jgi:hypothetical protein